MFNNKKGSSAEKDTNLLAYVGIGIIFAVAVFLVTIM